MNKILFLYLMISFVTLKASNDDASSPLMMLKPNQKVLPEKKSLQIDQQEHKRETTDEAFSTPPSKSDDNEDEEGQTTGERTVSSSPVSKPPSQLQHSKAQPGPLKIDPLTDFALTDIGLSGSTSNRSHYSGCTTLDSKSTSWEEEKSDFLIANDNLKNAHLAISDAVIYYQSPLSNYSNLDSDKLKALADLSTALSSSCSAWNTKNNASYAKLEQEVLSKIQNLKVLCEIEDSEKVASMEEDDAMIPFQAASLSEVNDNKDFKLYVQSTEQIEEECQRIKNKILTDFIPLNHYDPLHPIVVANTTLTDGIQFPIFLPWAFQMKLADCVKAGLAADLISSLRTSPYLQAKLLACFPSCTHAPIRGVNAIARQLVDPGYVFYYIPGWYELKLGTAARIAGYYILPSAIIRKLTWRFFQGQFYRGSLKQRALAVTAHDPRMTSVQLAFKDALERFGPDIVAATARSFLSNLDDYNHGKISSEEIFTKTIWSASVYMMATIGFYTFYRILEAVMIRTQVKAPDSYQDFARADLQKIQCFKRELSFLKPASSRSRSLITSSPSQNKLAMSCFQDLSDVRVDALSHALKFLDSPVANLMGDPFYRWSFGHDQNAIESFRVLDASKLLRIILPFLKSADVQEKKQAYAAFMILKNYLITNSRFCDLEEGKFGRPFIQRCSISNSRFSTDEYDSTFQNKIDVLIEFFKKFSEPETASPSRSLLNLAPHRTYHALSSQDNDQTV